MKKYNSEVTTRTCHSVDLTRTNEIIILPHTSAVVVASLKSPPSDNTAGGVGSRSVRSRRSTTALLDVMAAGVYLVVIATLFTNAKGVCIGSIILNHAVNYAEFYGRVVYTCYNRAS